MNTLNRREIVEEDLVKLLQHFIHTSHRANSKDDAKGLLYTDDCERLFNKDYAYTVIPNLNGELCCHYPYKVFVLEYEKEMANNKDLSNVHGTDVYENLLDIGKLKQYFWAARSARCRGRFVVPVILFEGKQICRSGTLSTGMEMFGRIGIDFFLSSDSSSAATASNISNLEQEKDGQSEWPSHDKIRGHDIKLLKYLKINYICDLMVEKKKVKYYMRVASSEKVDKESRYSDFCLLSLPYPGCEFFKEWKEHAYCGQEVKYDWNQPSIDAALDIPNELYSLTDVHWEFYKDWDLLLLTKNYFKLLISLIREGSSGILVHCISGWDRTPLYISLLRLSLWADGAIHQSLKPEEILYLTIAYDWYLFGLHGLYEADDRVLSMTSMPDVTMAASLLAMGGTKRKSSDTLKPSARPFPEDVKVDYFDSVFHNNEGNAEKEPEKELEKELVVEISELPQKELEKELVVEISEFPQKNKNENNADNKENGEVRVTNFNLLTGSYASSSMSTSPSGAQIFLSEDTQSAAYIHHKVPNTANHTATTETGTSATSAAEKLHCHQLGHKLTRCGLTSSLPEDSPKSAARNIDITNQKSGPISSPNHLDSVTHYTPGWFSSPAHSAHISSPATLTHSLSEENVPSRSSRLACVRNMFFHAYSIAESSNVANTSSMLDSLTEGFRWGSVRSDM